MTSRDHERMLRFLDGAMPPDEADALRAQLDSDPELRRVYETQLQLRRLLADSRSDSFAPYFADRVMRRVRPAPLAATSTSTFTATPTYESIRWVFARLALASLLVVALLSSLNHRDYGMLDVSSSVVDSVFNLPSADLEDAMLYTDLSMLAVEDGGQR